MDNVRPRFERAAGYKHLSVTFDDERYTDYLHSRGADPTDIGNLTIRLTDEGQIGSSVGYYAFSQTETTRKHLIALSPNRLPTTATIGRVLRHETEHYLYSHRHPNYLRRRYVLLGVAVAAGAVVLGQKGWSLSNSLVAESNYHLDDLVDGVAAGACGAAGGVLAGLYFAVSGKVFGPSELSATYAEFFRRRALPSDVLTIN